MKQRMEECTACSCLRDAGCSEELIEKYCSCGNTAEVLSLLQRHRDTLVKELCATQRKLDCLDYLVYHIRKD